MQQDYHIAIVGGGLVGASLALALADLPIKIALIDQVPPLTQVREDYDARSVALSHSSCQIFRSLGVFDNIQAFAQAIDQVHVSEQGRFGFARITAQQQNLEALGYVIEIPKLLLALSEAIAQKSNITRIAPAKLTDLKRQEQQWQLSLEGADAIQAELVVAADGAQSPIRQKMGLNIKEQDYEQFAIVGNITLNQDHGNIAYERFTKQGPLALLPLREKQVTMVCTIPKAQQEFFKGLPDKEFLQLLRQWFGYRLGRFEHIGRRVMFPLRLIEATEQYVPGLVIVGNAAHNLHPIAAQGFNLGLRDVAYLAEVIAGQVKQQASLSDEELLKNYFGMRQGDQRKTILFSHNLVKLFSNDIKPLALLRNAGMVGLDILPTVKQSFAKYGMGSWGRSSRLARGLAIDE